MLLIKLEFLENFILPKIKILIKNLELKTLFSFYYTIISYFKIFISFIVVYSYTSKIVLL